MFKKLSGKTNLFSLFTAVLFAILLWAPLLQSWLNIFPEQTASEKRSLEQFPELKNISFKEVFEFLGKYDKYYNDNFGFRGMLISMNSYFRVKVLKVVHPMPRVILGKEGWLFYNDPQDGVSIPDYCGLAPLSEKQMEQIRLKIGNLNARLKEKGVQLLIVVAPNKHTIYPEYLPPIELRASERTRLDQILDYFEKNSEVPVLDLRNALRQAKSSMPVYCRNDTHWNQFGGFIAYREIMGFLSQRFNVHPDSLSDFDMNVSVRNGSGDLASMLAMTEAFEDTVIEMRKRDRLGRVELFSATDEDTHQSFTCMAGVSQPGLPRLLMFHDSFGYGLIEYLSEHFSKSTYVPPRARREIVKWVDREKPDIVILELVERYLEYLGNFANIIFEYNDSLSLSNRLRAYP